MALSQVWKRKTIGTGAGKAWREGYAVDPPRRYSARYTDEQSTEPPEGRTRTEVRLNGRREIHVSRSGEGEKKGSRVAFMLPRRFDRRERRKAFSKDRVFFRIAMPSCVQILRIGDREERKKREEEKEHRCRSTATESVSFDRVAWKRQSVHETRGCSHTRERRYF